jgi:hypothetical protein
MNMLHSDVVVHIDETLDDQRIRDLEQSLGERAGIYSACVNERARHLMVVDYDPSNIRSGEILSGLRSGGLHAELIGL